MTINYIIFLRCETVHDLGQDDSTLDKNINNSCLLVNMIPISHLKVKKHSSRKLEIMFPTGSIGYFKLLMCHGCGKAWSQWRSLEYMCDGDILPVIPESKLISLFDLDEETQRILVDQKFTVNFGALKRCKIETLSFSREKFNENDSLRIFTMTSDLESRMLSSVVENFIRSKKDSEESESNKGKKIISLKSSTKTIAPSLKIKKSKTERKTRQIKRFGEGVPEGCGFGLSLSYEELIADKDFCNELNRKTRKNNEETSKNNKETSKNNEDYQFNNSFSAEKLALKMIPDRKADSESSKYETRKRDKNSDSNKERKKGNKSENASYIFKATQFFTNVSVLIIPDGLRKSKSIDSVHKISHENYDRIYLTSNISLPNINEIIMYRRCNRLSYSMDYFGDPRSTCSTNQHSISFWLPSGNTAGGRLYCTSPMCRKLPALQAKTGLKHSQEHIPRINLKYTLKPIPNRCLAMYKKNQSPKRNEKERDEPLSLFIKSTAMTTKALQEMENEYPERQRLLGKSLSKSNTTSHPSSVNQRSKREKSSRSAQNKITPHGNRSRVSSKSFLDPTKLEPKRVAYELQRFQRRLFCEIESPELARYVLKPHTVNEVNCPFLCGFLFFFERLKYHVVAEVLSQKSTEEAAEIHRIFVKVALSCLKRRDEHSAYAIIGALCNPLIMKHKMWLHILQRRECSKYLSHLFKECWKKRKLPTTAQKLPFFLNFITFLAKTLIQKLQNFNYKSESVWKLLTASSDPLHTRNKINRKVFSELRVLCHGNSEKVFRIIEECRKYYHLENSSLTDNNTREYLLFKPYS